jgi:methylated-DNA-[protein]-cysteine S-methyltransferase
MTQLYSAYYSSEIGWLEVTGTEAAVLSLSFIDEKDRLKTAGSSPAVAACLQQLDEYFQGRCQAFSLPLEPAGTGFQRAVWQQLLDIPYGRTVSYLDIARAIGNEKAVRAVGHANGQNKIALIIPCHRVIGSSGKLTGYGGGMWRKAWLLNHEQKFSSPQLALF